VRVAVAVAVAEDVEFNHEERIEIDADIVGWVLKCIAGFIGPDCIAHSP
jgi:hypothetical protein